MSIFNYIYKMYDEYEPVGLYNWQISFILDDDAREYMENIEYVDNKIPVGDGKPHGSNIRKYTWEEQSQLLTFMCKKCNLPKKKISEVNTYCRGMRASFNGGITIDSSLSLSFDESSSMMISRILNNLSNFYSNCDYIYSHTMVADANERQKDYSSIDKCNLANEAGQMIGGFVGMDGGYTNYDGIDAKNPTGKKINRDLTIKVKMYQNKYGYMNTIFVDGEEKPIQEFVFYKCFINNLNFGDGFEYGSEENLSIDCEIMYNWYTFGNILENGYGEEEILGGFKSKNMAAPNMKDYNPGPGNAYSDYLNSKAQYQSGQRNYR